jgi:hypothetical protein
MLVRERASGLKVRTNVMAGRLSANHNQTLVQRAAGLKVRTNLKAGGQNLNHSEALVREQATRSRAAS